MMFGITAALMTLAGTWNGGLTRAEVDVSSGQEFVQVDASGGVHVLTAARTATRGNPDTAKARIAKIPLENGEALIDGPVFFQRTGIIVGGKLFTLSKTTLGWRQWNVNFDGTGKVNSVTRFDSPSRITLPVQAGVASPVVVQARGAQVYSSSVGAYDSIQTLSGVAMGAPFPVDVSALIARGDSLVAVLTDGRGYLAIRSGSNFGTWGQVAPAIGSPVELISADWIAVAGSIRLAVITTSGAVKVSSATAWADVSLPDAAEQIALPSDAGQFVVRARLRSGYIVEAGLGATKLRWILRSPLQKLGFTRTSGGSRDAESTGMAPAGFGVVQRAWARLWGVFHHRGTVALGDLEVDPEVYSATNNRQLLVRLASAGTMPVTIKLDVIRDSASGSRQANIVSNQNLPVGVNDWHWNGVGTTSGKYWVRARVQSSSDSLILWKSFVVDVDRPTGAPRFLWSGPLASGAARVSDATPLTVVTSSIRDLPDTAAAWQGAVRWTNTAGGTWEWPFVKAATLKFDGKDAGGARLPDGQYSISVTAADRASNSSDWVGPWKLARGLGDTVVTSTFQIKSFLARVDGSVSPFPLRAGTDYQATVTVRIRDLDAGTLSLRQPGGNVLACPDRTYSSITIPRGVDTTLVLKCSMRPQSNGWVSGKNDLTLVVKNAQGDSIKVAVPVVIDSVATVISSPTEGANVSGTVPVRGVATSTDLGAGFQQYRAWWIRGIVQLPAKAKNVQELLGSRTWTPMPVPLSAQQPIDQVGLSSGNTDGRWPRSNTGIQDQATDGLLAWFDPQTKDTGSYTLVVATEGASGLISYDSKRVKWAPGRSGGIALKVVDSSRVIFPGNPLRTINLQNASTTDDSLVWGLSATSGTLDVSGVLVPSDSLGRASAGVTLDVRSMRLTGSTLRFVQTGRTGFGAVLDSGWYAWQVQAWNASTGTLIDTQLIFRVLPDTSVRSQILTVSPTKTRYLASLGAAPRVSVSVSLPRLGLYRLLVRAANQDSLVMLADSIKTLAGTWSWNFRVGGKLPVGDSLGFFAVLRDLARSGAPVVASSSFTLISEQKELDTSVIVLSDSLNDPLWTPQASTEFKFRALARGSLAYFPERRVDFAPQVEGTQVVRKFLTVPFAVDYIKFYNSMEFISSSQWNLRSFESHLFGSDDWPERGVTGQRHQGTLWATPWLDRWKLKSVQDSATARSTFLSQVSSVSVSDSSFASSAYFGDLPWIDLGGTFSNINPSNDDDAYAIGKNFEMSIRGSSIFNQYPMGDVNNRSRSYREKLNQACEYRLTLNHLDYETPDNFCNVLTRTNNTSLPGDKWVGVNSGNARVTLAQWDPSNRGSVTDGPLILSYDGVPNNAKGINSRASLTKNLFFKSVGREGPGAPRLYWLKRSRGSGYVSDLSIDGDDDWENDDEQGVFLGLPVPYWNSPYLLAHGQFVVDLNQAEIAMKDSTRSDRLSWSQNSANSRWNCWIKPDDQRECPDNLLGPKVGLRGFAYQPFQPTNQLYQGKNGRSYNQFDYIKNFFDRDSGKGLAFWQFSQTHPSNDDQLGFKPVLNIDSSMFQVTWDSIGIPYPLESYESPGAMYIEKVGDSILAFHAQESVDYFNYTQDTGRFLRLRAGTAFPAQTVTYVDSATIRLDSMFAGLLALTDSTGKRYGFIRRNSLHASVALQSHRVQPDGILGELEASNLHLEVKEFQNPWRATVYYRNKPDTMKDWSSALDTTFRRTKGWIYGGGEFNKTRFQGRAAALDTHGFLGMVNPSNLPDPSASSAATFFREKDALGRYATKFNPSFNISNFSWDLEVFHADGSTVNGDLPIQGQSPQNFLLGLDPRSGTRSWIGFRGTIRDTMRVGGQDYRFHDYSVLVRPVDDTSGFQPVPVNKFFTKDSVGDQAIYLPRTGADPWDRDSLMPALAWWENTGKAGRYEVAVVIHYAKVSDGSLHAVVQRRSFVSGTLLSGGADSIDAPYQRASIAMPTGSTLFGTSLSLSVVAPSSLSQRVESGRIAPIGPVVEIHTDGRRVFSSDSSEQPTLTYRISARELYDLEGIPNFDSATIPFILQNLHALQSKYRLHDLGSDGKLEALPTLVSIDSGTSTDRDLIHIVLWAKVPHFSWIFLQRDDGHSGHRPVITSSTSLNNGVQLDGFYQEDARAGLPLFVAKPLPTDLRLSWMADTSRSVDWLHAPTMPVAVKLDGAFRQVLPWDSLPLGISTLFVRYDSSRTGASVRVAKESPVLHVWNWTDAGQPVTPQCGVARHTVTFSADRSGTLNRILLDSLGTIRQVGSFAYTIGANSMTWDGCLDGAPARGVWTMQFVFPDALQNHSLQVAVGRRPQGVAEVLANPDRFAPSTSNPAHGVVISVNLRSGSPLPVHLSVRSGAGVLLGRLPDLTGNDSTRSMLWNGRLAGAMLPAGSYRIEAWLGSDSLSRVDRQVALLTAKNPGIVFRSDRDTFQLPKPSGQLRLSTNLPVRVRIKLVDSTGDSAGFVAPSMIQEVAKFATWNWSAPDTLHHTPVAALATWTTLDGLVSGIDTVRWVLLKPKTGIDSIQSAPASDTIWPDLNPDLDKAFGKGMPNGLDITTWASKSVKLLLTVRDAANVRVRRDTVSVKIGASTFRWNGRGKQDSVLRSGLYKVQITLLDTSRVIHSRNIWVQGLPDLVLIRDRAGLADRTAQVVAMDRSLSVVVWDAPVALAYMRAKPQGAVASVSVPVDSSVFMGDGWNSIYRFVRGGGRFAVQGELPLSNSQTRSGDVYSPGPMLALIGAASPYLDSTSMAGTASQAIRTGVRTTWMDKALAKDLSLLQRADTLRGIALRDSVLERLPGIFAKITGGWRTRQVYDSALGGYRSDTVTWTQSFYRQPYLAGGSWDTLGAVLCVHPTGGIQTATDSTKLVADYGQLIRRFFFGNDLMISATGVQVPDTVKIGQKLIVKAKPSYIGALKLDSAIVRVRDGVAGIDSLRKLRWIQTGMKLDAQWSIPVGYSMKPGAHTLNISLDPFRQINMPTGDTTVESLVSNNLVSVSWILADTAKPVIALDSVMAGALVRRWSPNSDADSLIVRGTVRLKHDYGRLLVRWQVRDGAGKLLLSRDQQSTASALVPVSGRFAPLADLVHGNTYRLRLFVQDAFGNRDSQEVSVLADSSHPVLDRWTIIHGRGDTAVGSKSVRKLARSNFNLFDTLAGQAHDNPGPLALILYRGSSLNGAQILDTVVTAISSSRNLLAVRQKDSCVWILDAVDLAGNHSRSEVQALRNTQAPFVGAWATTRTMLDSMLVNDSLNPEMIKKRPLLITDTTGVRDGSYLVNPTNARLIAQGPGWTSSLDVRKGDTVSLVLEGLSELDLSLSLKLDGVSLSVTDSNPYLKTSGRLSLSAKYRAAVAGHRTQRFFRFVPTQQMHRLEISVLDSSGLSSTATLWIQMPLADQVIVDSAGDNSNQGADWGEVYQRRDAAVMPGSTTPETWNYWLLERRNPMVRGETDANVYRLLVDHDADSTTGDTITAAGRLFKGADVALEWTGLTGRDDGQGAQVRRLQWNPSSKAWVETSTLRGEGISSLGGFAYRQNNADDPYTDSVGQGDQRLPSGKVAAASGGAVELGLRSANFGSLASLRWVLLPMSRAADTIRGPQGWIRFTPREFKPIQVDGYTPDWWPDNTQPGVRVSSISSVVGDSLKVWMGLRNIGTRPVKGIQLKYWIQSDSTPRASLVGMLPAWKSMMIQSVVRDTSKGAKVWSVTLLCGSCTLPGGTILSPLGTLVLRGPGVASGAQDDWSQSVDTINFNGKFPAYDLRGSLLFGSEPQNRNVNLPIIKVTPSGTLWIRAGEKVIFRADSTYDPDGKALRFEWSHSYTGVVKLGLRDTFQSTRLGQHRVTLVVSDLANPTRAASQSIDIFVEDSSGNVGQRPVREEELYIFDDQWASAWSQEWYSGSGPQTFVRDADSVRAVDGSRKRILPSRGSKLLSVVFDSLGGMSMRATCTDMLGAACPSPVDLSKFTNLEFKVAMDADLRRPVRIWLSDEKAPPVGSEEKFAYLGAYLPDRTDASRWQTVSIPLSELKSTSVQKADWLALKVMADFDPNNGPMPRTLFDDIRLVRYKSQPGQLVTTRKSGIFLTANPYKSSDDFNGYGMAVRMFNIGQKSIQMDSLRLRVYYRSMEGQTRADTVWGPDTGLFANTNWIPVDASIDTTQLKKLVVSQGVYAPDHSLANATWTYRWVGNTSGPDAGLNLAAQGRTAFWLGMYSTGGRRGGVQVTGNPVPNHNGVQSLNWSWPAFVDIYQNAWRVVVEHRVTDTTWGRLWGIEPWENPGAVKYLDRETLRDPSDAVAVQDAIVAHIALGAGTPTIGKMHMASAAGSFDPKGHPLVFHWLDATGHVLRIGAIDSFLVADTGKQTLRVRVFDLTDPTRSALDSLVFTAFAAGKVVDSQVILNGRMGTWIPGARWGDVDSSQLALPTWQKSVDLPKFDAFCPVRLMPVGSDSIIKIPFGNPKYQGVRFEALRGALDTNRFTHLEFWVASSRDWSNRQNWDLPVRVWLTNQEKPGTGEDNHADEEDFNLLQTYLGSGKLARRWQKVSIPLKELIQPSLPEHSNLTKTLLKFMVDRSSTEITDSSRRADLFLTGMRWVKYSQGPMVTTRRVGVSLIGKGFKVNDPEGIIPGGRDQLDLRMVNPTRWPLRADSVRIRLAYHAGSPSWSKFSNNHGGRGTDENVDNGWFAPQASFRSITPFTSPTGRSAEFEIGLDWSDPAVLPAGKAWQGFWQQSFSNNLFIGGRSLHHYLPDSSSSFSYLTGLVVEHRQGTGWARLWGFDPGESPDTVRFWTREDVRIPSDTSAPSSSIVVTGPCSDTTTPPTTPTTTNTFIAGGDISALPPTGRDPSLVMQSVTVGGKPAVSVDQSSPNWNIKHQFIFDTAWAKGSVVDVQVYVDPAQMVGSAWAGTLDASTFDGFTWTTLNLTPVNPNAFDSAIGKWRTMRFRYDASKYVLGRAFDLQFLANGHGNNTGRFQFAIGSIWLEGTLVDTTKPPVDTSRSYSMSLDSLSAFSSCNNCVIVKDGARTAIAVTPSGGGTAAAFSLPITTKLQQAKSIQVDVKSEFTMSNWEQMWFFVDATPYRTNWDQYTASITSANTSTWTTVTLPFNGSLYGVGTTVKFMLAINANAPAGKRFYVDNLRWMP